MPKKKKKKSTPTNASIKHYSLLTPFEPCAQTLIKLHADFLWIKTRAGVFTQPHLQTFLSYLFPSGLCVYVQNNPPPPTDPPSIKFHLLESAAHAAAAAAASSQTNCHHSGLLPNGVQTKMQQETCLFLADDTIRETTDRQINTMRQSIC